MLIATLLLLLTQSPCEVILADSTGDQLARLADFEVDGLIQDPGEASAMWSENGNRTPRGLSVRTEGGESAIYWIDSAQDKVHRGVDLNRNGLIELFERRVVRNTGVLDGASTAQSIALTTDGAVWWCSDAGKRGLFRMRDLDSDGAFQGALELEVLVGADVGGHPIETDAGLQVMDTRNLTEVEALGDQVVVYVDGPDELMSSFRVSNEDGDLLDPGESRLFLNASGKNAAMPQNVDWASGELRSLAIPASSGGFFYGRLSLIAVDESGVEPVWYFACDSAFQSPYDTNQYQQGLNGLIYRAVDLNADGDLQDAGEVRLYYDGSHTSYQPMLEQIVALDVCGGALYVTYYETAARRIARFFDRDDSGTAEGPYETEYYWFDADTWQGLPPFANGLPQVRDMVAVPTGDFARANPLFQSMGPGCEYTQFGQPPTLHGVGRAVVGAKSFTVELRGAAAGSYTILLAGDDFPAWFIHFLPANLGFMGWPNCTQYLNPTWLRKKWTSGAIGDPTGGYASHTFDIPLKQELIGFRLRMQWIVYDWFGGISYSGGGEVELEAPQ